MGWYELKAGSTRSLVAWASKYRVNVPAPALPGLSLARASTGRLKRRRKCDKRWERETTSLASYIRIYRNPYRFMGNI